MISLFAPFLSKKVLLSLAAAFVIIAAIDLMLPGSLFWSDEYRFESEIRSLSENGVMTTGGSLAFDMPGDALVYSVPYILTGGGSLFYRAARVLNALLHVLTAVGAASIAQSIFKNRLTSLIVLFSMIIYPSLLAYQATILCETLFTFFLVWGFAFLFAWDGEARNEKYFYAAAASFVLSLYVKATITTLMPILILARALFVKRAWRDRVRAVVLSCVIFAVLMTPWWVRNYHVFGEFVPFTTSASANLYLGVNPVNRHAGIDWSTDVDKDENAAILALGDELAISRAYSEKSLEHILADKAEFLRRMPLKFIRFWNFQSNYKGDKYSSAFVLYNVALALSWGVACPLGLLSIWLNRERWREFLPIFAIIAYFTLIHVVVIASLRYRLPIEPLFIAVGADCLTRVLSRRAVI